MVFWDLIIRILLDLIQYDKKSIVKSDDNKSIAKKVRRFFFSLPLHEKGPWIHKL